MKNDQIKDINSITIDLTTEDGKHQQLIYSNITCPMISQEVESYWDIPKIEMIFYAGEVNIQTVNDAAQQAANSMEHLKKMIEESQYGLIMPKLEEAMLSSCEPLKPLTCETEDPYELKEIFW